MIFSMGLHYILKLGTHVNDHHLNLADEQYPIFERLRDVYIAVGHVDGLAPAAIDTFIATHVFLQ